MKNLFHSKHDDRPSVAIGAILAFILTLLIFGTIVCLWYWGRVASDPFGQPSEPTKPVRIDSERGEIERFDSEADFNAWLSMAETQAQIGFGGVFMGRGLNAVAMSLGVEEGASSVAPVSADGAANKAIDFSAPERLAETNVQVVGIDEPDIIKTNGQKIYYSPQTYYRETGLIEPAFDEALIKTEASVVVPEVASKIMPSPFYREPNVKAINVWPPTELKIDAEIERNGELLLVDNVLLVFGYDGVYAYDVSDSASPRESWKISYQNNNWPVAQRLFDGELYLILAGGIDRGRPCPYAPITRIEQEVSVGCADIWHPIAPTSSDVIYTVLKIDPTTGELQQQIAFVGSNSGSTIYMSAENIYVTHQYSPDIFSFVSGFLRKNLDIVPAYVNERLNKVAAYDISNEAKLVELQNVLGRWLQTLGEDESLRITNELQNRSSAYSLERRRELQTTGIVRIANENLEVKASGIVPGTFLNQFSLDEYDGYLRVATTTGNVGSWFWQFGFGTDVESVNDVYVLNMDLQVVGSALDLGLSERIFSARFIGERGYLVTFKQIDPFYVLDLSDPTKPEVKGELKIPGYSSYLHPIADNLILGVGKEDDQVKLSLFDVSDPTQPKERSKFSLKEYWSDILNTHHAFLLDDKFKIFFLPGGEGGYIFSYENDELKLVKAVSGFTARRALFLDDYLYVAGDAGLVVLSEKDWQRINELNF
jgi:uncharacterized secreted protein with C-terminal beta-propeller domain